jgi:glycosyltransferase involved in cell wall biosynthesis
LVQHLSSARALLFPSVVEGFGLPLVEALRMGIPVIASDVPVFREIGGDIPTYLDPRDEAGWESAIAEYSQDRSAVRAAQLDRITGFRAPTWPEHFERVEAWLGTLG